jgi:hypothetical protein
MIFHDCIEAYELKQIRNTKKAYLQVIKELKLLVSESPTNWAKEGLGKRLTRWKQKRLVKKRKLIDSTITDVFHPPQPTKKRRRDWDLLNPTW